MPSIEHEDQKEAHPDRFGGMHSFSCGLCSGGERNALLSEAQRPEGWPEITPVGKVELKERPAFRVAVAEASSGTGGEGRLFGTLFRHIQDRDIPMTAPVTMTRSSEGQMQSMGFLYENLEVGSTGEGRGVLRSKTVLQPRLCPLACVAGTREVICQWFGATARLS